MSSKSNTQILQELEELSDTLYQSHTSSRRTASLALPRDAIPVFSPADATNAGNDETALNPKPRARRMSLSPWRSRPAETAHKEPTPKNRFSDHQESTTTEKKGIWNWKPIRALAHIGMQKLSCLFSVEVVTVQHLPSSMNGLRLSVCVRKKETRDGAVQTMPSRVSQGAADFEETLFIRCHVYYAPGGGAQMKFEPRPFVVYALAVDAEELDFGRSSVDLSGLIQESVERSLEGTRIRQWDKSFRLSGKAKGGELLLKLGFQIMEKDGGTGIYGGGGGDGRKGRNSPSVARKQSKTSFSVPSPKLSARAEPRMAGATSSNEYQQIEDLNLDDPKTNDLDLPDFEVVDRGVEVDEKQGKTGELELQGKTGELQGETGEKTGEFQGKTGEKTGEFDSDERSLSSEVVKEVVTDRTHMMTRLTELDSIAQQIKALESMMGRGDDEKAARVNKTGSPTLDADEDKVTREFFQMLEDDSDENDRIAPPTTKASSESEESVFLSDLGKGLGCVVQTRNGGYLTSANPFDTKVARKETPKLALQVSKPMLVEPGTSGFELFQRLAGAGLEGLTSEMMSAMPIDELKGKTAEQVAFEGIASAIVEGRNREEGASSSAARTIAAVKSMVGAMVSGREERAVTGIWSVGEEPVAAREILAFSLQKIESMAVEGLRIQADVAEEEAPFDVSPLDPYEHLLGSGVPVEGPAIESEKVTIAVVVQLRDPVRQYEGIGGPMIAMIHAEGVEEEEEEKRYKVGSLQVGGVLVRSVGVTTGWDAEKQKLTAMQWLVENGMGKKGKRGTGKGPDVLWSISSRVMADMWLKPIRNPDVKFVMNK